MNTKERKQVAMTLLHVTNELACHIDKETTTSEKHILNTLLLVNRELVELLNIQNLYDDYSNRIADKIHNQFKREKFYNF